MQPHDPADGLNCCNCILKFGHDDEINCSFTVLSDEA